MQLTIRTAVLVAFAMGLQHAPTCAQDLRTIDLTTPGPSGTAEASPARVRGPDNTGASDGGRPADKQWPLKLTLLSVTQMKDGSLTVDLRLEAVQRVSLPVSRDHRAVGANSTTAVPSVKELIPRLELTGATGQVTLSTTEAGLSGSDLLSESLLTLQAGQSIRLHYRTFADDIVRRTPPRQPLKCRGVLMTIEGRRVLPDLYSENVVELSSR